MDAAQLADDLKAQLELAQKKLHDFQDEIVENSVTKEKDMFNFKRAQVCAIYHSPLCPSVVSLPLPASVKFQKGLYHIVCALALSLSLSQLSRFFSSSFCFQLHQ